MKLAPSLLALAGTLLFGPLLSGQTRPGDAGFGVLDGAPVKARHFVAYAAEQQLVAAGKRAELELRFHVNPGFHVNSHRPKSDLLIPTLLSITPAAGVKIFSAQYPAGSLYSLTFDPKEKLDVYADEFTVKLPVVANAGPHELKGELKYQACDRAACYPAKSLPVVVVFTAK